MNGFRIARSGFLVLATALGVSMIEGASLPSALPLGIQAVQAQNYDEETSIRVYQQASPAVVSIDAGDGTGSGSIITDDGLVLTNAHVVGDVRTVTVQLSDGRSFTGDVVGYAQAGLDLAAVQIRGGRNLPTIDFASSDAQVGQRAFAIGNPFGLQGTFTVGIVSRLDQDRGLIQTDAAINPGNSGGPLLNSSGQLIGVNTSIFTTGERGGNIGIGFAIATNQVRPFIASVQNGTAATVASGPDRTGERPPVTLTIDGPQVSGRLDAQSYLLGDNTYFNVYEFSGRAGQRVSIEMASQQIDPYLILVGPDGEDLGQDDDGAGGLNARIEVTLPQSGTYVVLANTYGAGEQGSYNLSVASLGAGSAMGGSAPSGYLINERGQLDVNDSQLSDNSFYDEYWFEGQAGQRVVISMVSDEFDTFLLLLDESGERLAQNDDASGTSNAEIVLTLPRTGAYRVIANAYDASGRGQYQLTVE
ncbi:MAG: trypsin-like peptidase domain-containing protein [Cyanobacteria bacterium J06626_23]